MAATGRAVLPAPFFVRGFLVRGVAFWVFVRLVVTAGSMMMQDPGLEDPVREAFRLAPPALLAVVTLVYGLVFIDARRRNNLVFLANMGVGRIVIGVLVVGPVLLAELIVGVVL
jgi:hypothetical protein